MEGHTLDGLDGFVLDGYQITEKIGEGGMADVYGAVHGKWNQRAAVKVLRPEMSGREKIVERFWKEARAMGSIDHPGVVKVYACDYTPDGRAYIIMERLNGKSLKDKLKEVGTVSVATAAQLIRQLAGVMKVAHEQKIIHRDLKPDNVFVAIDPDAVGGERIKVLDFGLAKFAEGMDQLTGQDSVFGTPAYMAPEQCQRSKDVDARADIYSIGCIFYRCLCGSPPFGLGGVEVMAAQLRLKPTPVRSVNKNVPPAIDALIGNLLSKSPDERVPSCAALIQALDDALAASPVSVEHEATEPFEKITKRLPGLPPTLPRARPPQLKRRNGPDTQVLDEMTTTEASPHTEQLARFDSVWEGIAGHRAGARAGSGKPAARERVTVHTTIPHGQRAHGKPSALEGSTIRVGVVPTKPTTTGYTRDTARMGEATQSTGEPTVQDQVRVSVMLGATGEPTVQDVATTSSAMELAGEPTIRDGAELVPAASHREDAPSMSTTVQRVRRLAVGSAPPEDSKPPDAGNAAYPAAAALLIPRSVVTPAQAERHTPASGVPRAPLVLSPTGYVRYPGPFPRRTERGRRPAHTADSAWSHQHVWVMVLLLVLGTGIGLLTRSCGVSESGERQPDQGERLIDAQQSDRVNATPERESGSADPDPQSVETEAHGDSRQIPKGGGPEDHGTGGVPSGPKSRAGDIEHRGEQKPRELTSRAGDESAPRRSNRSTGDEQPRNTASIPALFAQCSAAYNAQEWQSAVAQCERVLALDASHRDAAIRVTLAACVLKDIGRAGASLSRLTGTIKQGMCRVCAAKSDLPVSKLRGLPCDWN